MKCTCKSPHCNAELQMDTMGGTITAVRTQRDNPSTPEYTNSILVYMTPESAKEMIEQLKEYIQYKSTEGL